MKRNGGEEDSHPERRAGSWFHMSGVEEVMAEQETEEGEIVSSEMLCHLARVHF